MKLRVTEFQAPSEIMNQQEVKRRDRILRAYFEGFDWNHNGEYELKRTLVINSDRLLPDYPYIVENEWEVEPGQGHKGRGDLVFTDGVGRFAVVEVKCLNRGGNGDQKKAQRDRIRVGRRLVEAQARRYAKIYAAAMLKAGVIDDSNAVAAFVFTDEQEYPYFLLMDGELVSQEPGDGEAESLQITNFLEQSPSVHLEPVAALNH